MSSDRSILIVEDDKSMRLLLGALVDKEPGLKAIQAGDGAEAVELATGREISAIVLDMMLPDMSGLEVLQKISVERDQDLPPVIVITGSSRTVTPDEVIRGSFAGGIYEIFRKPIDQGRFVEALHECVDEGPLITE